jgi:hypothetical protein
MRRFDRFNSVLNLRRAHVGEHLSNFNGQIKSFLGGPALGNTVLVWSRWCDHAGDLQYADWIGPWNLVPISGAGAHPFRWVCFASGDFDGTGPNPAPGNFGSGGFRSASAIWVRMHSAVQVHRNGSACHQGGAPCRRGCRCPEALIFGKGQLQIHPPDHLPATLWLVPGGVRETRTIGGWASSHPAQSQPCGLPNRPRKVIYSFWARLMPR